MNIKNFFKPVMAMMVLASFCGGVTSCSDSDDPIVATVNNGELKVDINRIGGTVEIPVESNGDWKVSVENLKNSDIEWAGIISDSVGKGSGKIVVAVDYLSPKKQIQERTADIVLECGGKTQTVKLRQYIGLESGETAVNDGAAFSDVWASKGVGSGLDVLTGEQTSNMILNVKGLINLAKSDEEFDGLFRQTTIAKDEIGVALSDTLESDTSKLAVECNINIKYAQFKLGINVKYDNTGLLVQNAKRYNATQSVIFSKSSTDLMTVQAILENDPELARKVTTYGFRNSYKKVIEALDSKDDAQIKKATEALYSAYGPVVVTGAELGGSIFFSLEYDSVAQENNFKVNGKVTAAIPLGPVKIGAKVDVEYSKAGLDIWNNSRHCISASGGNQETLSALTSLMTEQQPNLDKIQEAGQKWINAITSSSDNTDNTAVVNVSYQGIWDLFPLQYRDTLKEWAVKYYQALGQPLCVKLSAIGLNEKTKELPKK